MASGTSLYSGANEAVEKARAQLWADWAASFEKQDAAGLFYNLTI
jgi:hypothetical protein